jgi:hypothetical protein
MRLKDDPVRAHAGVSWNLGSASETGDLWELPSIWRNAFVAEIGSANMLDRNAPISLGCALR